MQGLKTPFGASYPLYLFLSLLFAFGGRALAFDDEDIVGGVKANPQLSLLASQSSHEREGKKSGGLSRGQGTAIMVLGIVFTPITGVVTIFSAAEYFAARDYNCSWAKEEGYEEGRKDSDNFIKAREDCAKAREDQMRSSAVVGGVALVGLGISVFSIVKGVMIRRANASLPYDSKVEGLASYFSKHIDFYYGPSRRFDLVWNMEL